MGKKTRRKRQHGKKQSETTSQTRTPSTTKGPAILQRIRHADPRTRHAALTALCHTSPKMSPALLQAVRERVVDEDLDCAIAAASCLSNYLDDGDHPEQDDLTAGWMVIFVSRLQECFERQWLSLAYPLLQCVCRLLENNPIALERLIPNPPRRTAQLRNDCLQVLCQWLEAPMASAEACDISILVSRALHSVLDDNGELFLPWLHEEPEAARKTLQLFMNAVRNPNESITTRLHCVGAWMSCWMLCQVNGVTGEPLLLSSESTSQCVAVLHSALDWSISTMQPLVQQLCQAHADYQKELADDELERQVIQAQEEKKEPARRIARRLKKEGEARMEDDDAPRGKLEQDRKDQRQVWEDTQTVWLDTARPVQLALEIAANLTSCVSEMPPDEDEDDQVMAEVSVDEELCKALLQQNIPDRLIELLGKLVSSSWTGGVTNLPEIVQETCSDLQSKVGACMGNSLANLGLWSPPDSLWHYLKVSFENSMGEAGREGICSAMVVALRSRSSIRTRIQPTDLDFLLTILQREGSEVIARDTVCMLGILCSSEKHPAEVNQKVCQTLLQTMSEKDTAMIMAEVLNVLMDIYGDDDCHPQVFESLDVLNHFQRFVPQLKQRISVARDASPEDIEQWKESAMNASQFIQYKKGYS